MEQNPAVPESLSSWWKHGVVLTMVLGFTVLIWLAVRSYRDAPPIPNRVASPLGETLFTGQDILAGQQVFLKYGLMDNGSVWGHGAYLGSDYSAKYLHTLSMDTKLSIAESGFHRPYETLSASDRDSVEAEARRALKQNRYDSGSGTLAFTDAEVKSYQRQIGEWTDYFAHPVTSAGLPERYIRDSAELRQLTAFFAWTAWASVASRPGRLY